MNDLSPPGPAIPVRILNRLHRVLPIKSKLILYSILFVKELGAETCPRDVQGVSFGLAEPEDLEVIKNHPEGLSNRVYSRRIRNGDQCYCLKRNGEVVCYNWVRFTTCCVFCGRKVSFNFMPLLPGQAFVYDLYTYEQYRGEGLGSYMKECLVYELCSKGIKEMWSIVEPGNSASIRIHIRLGSKMHALVYGFGLFNWTKTFFGSRRDEESMRKWISRLSDSMGTSKSRSVESRDCL